MAVWTFDEPEGLYPSCILEDLSPNAYPMVLGPGGQIVTGKYGNALSASAQDMPEWGVGSVLFGLTQVPTAEDRTVAPMSWHNALHAGLIPSGENHLRKEFHYPNVTRTGMNLGDFDWTVEFWFKADRGDPGVVFELGTGPRGENTQVTAMRVNPKANRLEVLNQPGSLDIAIPVVADGFHWEAWNHFALVFHSRTQTLTLFTNGKPGTPVTASLESLPEGEEAYLSVGRNGTWEEPLPGLLDELRFSHGRVYTTPFTPPDSFNPYNRSSIQATLPEPGLPLLFSQQTTAPLPLPLGNRKHLFLDDAIAMSTRDITFVPNPPGDPELAFEIKGAFRKHVTVIEDEAGRVRIYAGAENDQLAVWISEDGLNFEAPAFNKSKTGSPNIVIPESTAMGTLFIDPHAPDSMKWKYISGFDERGIHLFASPDGLDWTHLRPAVIPLWPGSQSNMFFDDQRGLYVAYHRSDMGDTLAGKTERRFVMTEERDLTPPWGFRPVSTAEQEAYHALYRLDRNRPWFVDNGPLTPGGFGIEYPAVFKPTDYFDPVGVDFYVPKATKYPGAPDAYVAFAAVFFHYEGDGPETRTVLVDEARMTGNGTIETQLMTSRDGIDWKRHPRPVFVNVGPWKDWHLNEIYHADGLIMREQEIWLYFYGTEEFHSSVDGAPDRRGIFRTILPRDRFVAAEAPYDREGQIVTKPLVFSGNRLEINVDTGATGYVQVGLLKGNGRPLEGVNVDDCVYVNGNHLDHQVEWLNHGTNVSPWAGQPVRLVFRLRGARLYGFQFKD